MPITTNQNKPNGFVVLRATGNDTINLATAAATDETVQSMAINEIKWACDSSQRWTVTRGSDTVAILTGSGGEDFVGMRLETDAQLTANCNVALSGGNGYIVVRLHKVSGN